MRVRALDDLEDMTAMLSAVLRGTDIEVTATNSDFAVLLHEDQWEGYDAALVDLALCEPLTGVDVVRWLHDKAPHVRIVILSANADLGAVLSDEVRTLADAVLTKPASRQQIIDALGGTDVS